MLRIEHSHDMFFANMNHVKIFRERENKTEHEYGEYELASLSTRHASSVYFFITPYLEEAMASGEEVQYSLTHLTDME